MSSMELRNVSVIEGQSTVAAVWSDVLKAMLQPLEGQPSRPSRIEFGRPELRQSFNGFFRELDCDCQIVYQMPQLQKMLSAMDTYALAKRTKGLASSAVINDLRLANVRWQIGFFHHPIFLTNRNGDSYRPWAVVVLDGASEMVLGNEFIEGEPDAAKLWQSAMQLMHRESIRPSRIELSDSEVYDALKNVAQESGIECMLRDELSELHEFLSDLVQSYRRPEKCSLADGHQVGLDAMESFYETASNFYRQAPWTQVVGDVPIQVHLPGGVKKSAVVLGRSGMTLGLAVYDQSQDMGKMMRGQVSADETSACVVIFGESESLAAKDLYLIERYGWPIANPDAFPVVMRLRPESIPTSPTIGELRILEALLRCIPQFVRSNEQTARFQPDITGLSSEIKLDWTLDRNRW